MKTMMHALLIALTLLASSVFAADLKSAKASGLVGEQNNGYLGIVVPNPPSDVQQMVNSVNDQRKAHFAQIAAKTGVSLDEAAKVFAKEAYERTEAGHYLQDSNGKWVKK